jgi:RNA polymerase sigma-70 factor, ECF subfamily
VGSVTEGHAGALLERHRAELTAYCYRLLASGFEAEDAVQETLVRAWRSFHRFDEARGPLLSWLYAIATRVCLDMLRSAPRRARAMDLAPPSRAGAPLGAPLAEARWVQPVPDVRVLPAGGDPGELAAARETIRLAFVALLQHLPPRQRAVLVLRDVLCWRAAEVAWLLGTSVPSVNSALQRARNTLGARNPTPLAPLEPAGEAQERLLARYVDAFERDDVDGLVSLLHEDAAMSMPPFGWWLRGRPEIRRAPLAPGLPCRGSRLVRTAASGCPAFGQYRPAGPGGRPEPFALVVLEVSGGWITGMTTYLDAKRLFPLFDLPALAGEERRPPG